jgi:hypothetical protein
MLFYNQDFGGGIDMGKVRETLKTPHLAHKVLQSPHQNNQLCLTTELNICSLLVNQCLAQLHKSTY